MSNSNETSISITDAKFLVKTEDTSAFRDVMDRVPALQQLFKGHSSACAECAPHKHMPCFINYIHVMSDKNPYRLVEIIDFFMECKGSVKERYNTMTEKYTQSSAAFRVLEDEDAFSENGSYTPPMPKEVESLIRGFLGGNMPSAGTHKLAIMVSPTEIVVKGDEQPSDEDLNRVLSNHIPNYKPGKVKVTRVHEDGKPFNKNAPVFVSPMQKLVEIDTIEDKVKAEKPVMDETGKSFIERMMKNN